MPRTRFGRNCLLAITFALLPTLTQAAAVHWNTGSNGNWSLASNWLPAVVPTASDTAVIDFAGSYTVTMDVAPTIAALRISGSSSGVQTVTASAKAIALPNASSIGAQGVLTLTTGCTVSGAGAITNEGALNLGGGGSVAQAIGNSGTLTVNPGSTSLNGALSNAVGATLRVSGTSTGATCVVANGFTNDGAIELTSSGNGGATLSVTAGTLTNSVSGTITSLAGVGGARTLAAALDNQGLITIERATTSNKASVSHLNSGTINLTTGNYTVVISTARSFTTTGTINVQTGRTLTLQGLNAGAANKNYNLNGGSMGGAGTVSVVSSTLNLNRNLPIATSSTRLDGNDCVVNGPDTLTFSSGVTTHFELSTLNAVTIVEAGATLELLNTVLAGGHTNSGILQVMGTCEANGMFDSQPGSAIRLWGGTGAVTSNLVVPGDFVNNGTMEFNSPVGSGPALFTSTAGSLINSATGTIVVLPAVHLREIRGHLENFGLLDIKANFRLNRVDPAHTNEGTVSIGAGFTLTFTGIGTFTNKLTGVLSGSGTISPGNVSIIQQGTIRPGGSAGRLSINDSVVNEPSSELDIEIGGASPGTGHDQLSVQGALTVDGTLNITLLNGYQPQPGTRYVIATCDGRSGTFDLINGLDYGIGQMWTVVYSDTNIVLLAQDQTWSRVFPDGTPPTPREGHTAVYDETNDRMTVFGGKTDAGVVNEVWVLSKAVGFNYPAWTKLTPTGAPPAARTNATAVYAPASNRMVVFGGDDGSVTPATFNDVWVLTNANGLGGTPAWIALSPQNTPPSARAGHAAAYDPDEGVMIVVGGDEDPANCGGERADAWMLHGATGLTTPAWSQISTSGTPPSARVHHGAAFDQASGRLLVVGGDACGVGNTEVWHLNDAVAGPATWSLLAPTQSPPADWTLARYAFDPASQWLDGFGGKMGAAFIDSAFTLTNAAGGGTSSWYRRLAYGDRPAPRTFHSMIMSSVQQTAVVFGGLTATGRTNTVWRRQVDKAPVLDVTPPPVVLPTRTAFALPPSPNPARGAVDLAVDVARDQEVSVDVFDLAGRRVVTLHSGPLKAGRHSFHWGARAAGSRPVAPGVYLVRLNAEDGTEVVRFVKL